MQHDAQSVARCCLHARLCYSLVLDLFRRSGLAPKIKAHGLPSVTGLDDKTEDETYA